MGGAGKRSPLDLRVRQRIANWLKGREFLRSALVLVSGTALAQLIMLLTLPLLTRLYAPEDFSVLALYLGIITIVASAACLGFDMAVAMPSSDRDAVHLLILAAASACLVALILSVLVAFWHPDWFRENAAVRLYEYRWLLPLGVLLTALFTAVQFYAVRRRAFLRLSTARVCQAFIGTALQAGGALLQWVPGGLLIGQMLASGGGILYLLPWIRRANSGLDCDKVSLARLRALAYEYRRFPQFTTFESLTNNIAIQLPIILIAMWLAGPEAGFLFLAMRVMQTPIGMVGSAIGQVYLSKAPETRRSGMLSELTGSVLHGAIKVGVLPIACMGVVAPGLFDWLFGESWSRAGELVSWMAPWLLLQYLASPISMVMHVQERQRMMLLLTCGGVVIRLGALLMSAVLLPSWVSEVYALSGTVFYLLCLLVFGKTAGLQNKQWLSLVGSFSLYALLGLFLGLLMNKLLGW